MNLLIATEYYPDSGLGHLSRIDELVSNSKTLEIEMSILVVTSEANLEFVQNYVSHHAKKNVSYSIEDVNWSKYDAIIIDALKFSSFNKLKESGLKIISLSPLFEFNHDVDLVISRGSINSAKPNTLSNVKFAIFKNLKVEKKLSKTRLVYHIGGGSKKTQILNEIRIMMKDLIFEFRPQEICFFEDQHFDDRIDYYPFKNFKFYETDIIISTGGLSLFEAAYSGLRTLNFYLSPAHAEVSGIDVNCYPNLCECGILGMRQQKIIRDELTQLRVQKPVRCEGAIHVLREIEGMVVNE